MKTFFKKWIISFILLPIVIFLIFNRGDFIFLLDHLNLLIHEGGHGIFSLFGRFLYTLGGTLMQIIIPGLVAFYFFINQKRTGLQVSIVWLGQNLMNIGNYASDARSQNLPLLGGKKVYHDWTYILNKTGLLDYDHIVGYVFIGLGIMMFVLALFLPRLMNNNNKVDIEMKL